MATRLDRALKRELDIDGQAYTVTIGTDGIKVVPKGKRNGPFVSWRSIVTGDAALAESLRISLDATGRDAP